MTGTHVWARLAALLVIVNGSLPALWILLTSLKTEGELIRLPITYLPSDPTVQNFFQAFREQPLGRFLWNSAAVATLSAALSVAVATLSAYSIARLKPPGRRFILGALIAVSTLPLITLVVPLFQTMRALGLLNTYLALILPNAVLSLPVCTLVLVSFFQTIPADLENAARLDGASRLEALWKVILPVSAPGVATAGILAFVNAWDEFLIALSLTSSQQMRTAAVGITLYQGEYAFPWPLISAALVVALIPVVLIVVAFQERVVSGLAAGALKG